MAAKKPNPFAKKSAKDKAQDKKLGSKPDAGKDKLAKSDKNDTKMPAFMLKMMAAKKAKK